MIKITFLILIIVLTGACGKPSKSARRGPPVTAPVPTPVPFGADMHLSPGHAESSAAGMAMTASIGSSHQVTSAAGVAAEVSIGVPSSSSQ